MSSITVMNPHIADDGEILTLAPQLAQLKDARVAYVDNSKVNADLFLSRVRPMLEEVYGIRSGITIRKLAPKDELTDDDLRQLAEHDAVIQCFGDCGTSTSISVFDGVRLERLGIPTATVCSTAFSGAARSQAAGRGMCDLPIIEIPHPMHTAPAAAVKECAEAAVGHLVGALTQRYAKASENVVDQPAETVELADLPETLQEFFFKQGWTDGLPVVPPTSESVQAMLAAAGRDPAEKVGIIPPRMRTATVEKIAINAVMAGCRPEYFPVVLAAVDAVLDENCRLYGIQTATNNSSPLIIVNGPVAKKLGMNAKGNVFGQGCRATATIGRALQLVLRNIGGDLPGETDMSTQGQTGKFTFCIAENEAESPWEPLHVEHGFAPEDSTVTVIGASAGHNVFTYGCETGAEIIDHFVGALTALGHNNIIFPTGPLLVFGPEHAGVLARDGYTKASIREHLFKQARIPISRFGKRTVRGLHHRRAGWFSKVNDPEHIGVADRPEDITIVVAGGAGIHSQFVPTSFSYHPVIRRILLR